MLSKYREVLQSHKLSIKPYLLSCPSCQSLNLSNHLTSPGQPFLSYNHSSHAPLIIQYLQFQNPVMLALHLQSCSLTILYVHWVYMAIIIWLKFDCTWLYLGCIMDKYWLDPGCLSTVSFRYVSMSCIMNVFQLYNDYVGHILSISWLDWIGCIFTASYLCIMLHYDCTLAVFDFYLVCWPHCGCIWHTSSYSQYGMSILGEYLGSLIYG